MNKMHVSILYLMCCYGIYADQQMKPDAMKHAPQDPFENMQSMINEAREIYRKFEEACKGQVAVASEVGLDISQDDRFVILVLQAKIPENLDISKDISIDVEDNLLVVHTPLKNGSVSLEVYDNRLTMFEKHEVRKEKKENTISHMSLSFHESAKTQLLPARVDVSNIAAIVAEYKEKEKKLILKLPKKLAKKITVSATTSDIEK